MSFIESFVTEHFNPPVNETPFPLTDQMFDGKEVVVMIENILSNHITYGPKVVEFERAYADFLNVPYAVMVNSGSSANLLALAVLRNPTREKKIVAGDHIIVPAVCWSTSVAPIIQLGCVPVYADVSQNTANIDLDHLETILKRDPRVKAIMAVHVIGASCDMIRFMEIVHKYDLLVIEDTCESMGSKYNGKYLGTFGNFGTFSMYYSHHMTCGEGGIVTCQTEEDYHLLLCLRAHGWTRHLPNKHEVEQQYPNIDKRFLFINTGFNLRPMSIQAVCASEQLKKLPSFIEARKYSYTKLYENMKNNQKFDIICTQADAAWFGFAIVLRKLYWHQLETLKEHLHSLGIEHRPIISGNMVRQPFNELYNVQAEASDFIGAEIIHQGGLFIGLHSKPLSDSRIDLLTSALLKFDWHPKPRILITGGSGMLGNALKSSITDATTLFLSSKDGDLRDLKQTEKLFRTFHPTHVIHAAADVGGLYKNLNSNFDIGMNNTKMNTNVIKCALKFKVQNLIAISSTCVFPENACNFDESMIHSGAPHSSNADYAMSKRIMHLHVSKVRESTGYKWNVLVPCNMYGPHDSFCPVNGHVIGSLIGKATSPSPTLEVYGTGKARRQFMYIEDFARIVSCVIKDPIWFQDLICAPKEEISIAETAEIVSNLTDKKIEYDKLKSDGQIKKCARSTNFDALFPEFKWTTVREGIHKTLEWYKQNN